MASNTKLFPDQKQDVKSFIVENPTVKFFDNGEVTVMVSPEFRHSRMYSVSLSTMSPDEIKFRKSVGKYYAICSRENGQYVLMNYCTLEAFLDNNLMIQTDAQCMDFASL